MHGENKLFKKFCFVFHTYVKTYCNKQQLKTNISSLSDA